MYNYRSRYLPTLLLCSLFLLLLAPGLSAQNYYVAFVKGKVFYNEAPLKVRDKITLSGNLRFSTGSDFIKVSGPSGLHTISPAKKDGGGYEFLRAVTAELFPVPKPVNSMVLSAWQDGMDYLGLHDQNQYMPDYFLEGEWRPVSPYLEVPAKDFYWVSATNKDKRPAVKAATLRDTSLVLDRTNFSFDRPDQTAYLFYVTQPKAFRKLIRRVDDLDDLARLFTAKEDLYGPDLPGHLFRLHKKYISKGEPARYLTYVIPEQILPSDEILEEMWFFFNQNPGDGLRDFMFANMKEAPGYDSILLEQYGEMNFTAVEELFERYARERGYEGE
jgi:hypothetical protein